MARRGRTEAARQVGGLGNRWRSRAAAPRRSALTIPPRAHHRRDDDEHGQEGRLRGRRTSTTRAPSHGTRSEIGDEAGRPRARVEHGHNQPAAARGAWKAKIARQ